MLRRAVLRGTGAAIPHSADLAGDTYFRLDPVVANPGEAMWPMREWWLQ